MTDRRVIAWRIGVGVLVLGTWEIAGRAAGSFLVPTASGTVRALLTLAKTREFWSALWLSNQALLIGYPMALAAGIVAGLTLARWRTLDAALDLYLQVLLVTPMAAVMPLVIMALGLGLWPRAAVVFTFAFPIITATVRAGARQVDERLVAMARSFCATQPQVWRSVILPGALPAVMTGARLGLGRAIAGMIAVELLLVAVGVGRLILVFRADFDAAAVYAVVAIVIIEAVGLLAAASAIERRLTTWTRTS
jgi:NitT/TauT family transport system permease protein